MMMYVLAKLYLNPHPNPSNVADLEAVALQLDAYTKRLEAKFKSISAAP